MNNVDLVRELWAIYEALPDNADVSGRALRDLLHRLEDMPDPQPGPLIAGMRQWGENTP